MTRFGEDWMRDPDAPESRFTRLPAIAIIPDEETEAAAHQMRDRADPRREAVSRTVGDWILDGDADLGIPETADASSGRGAELWAIALLWLALRIVEGAVQEISWEATKRIARKLKETVDRVRRSQASVHVSAGTARLIAIDAVLARYPDEEGPLDTQAVEEPSSMSGKSPCDLTYGPYEPWIVVLVDSARTNRYVVVVEPNGEVAAANRIALSSYESFVGAPIEVAGGTEEERREARRRAGREW